MGTPVPEFTEAERKLVATLVERRYGRPVDVEVAEAELLLDPARSEPTSCPTLYWTARGAQFVVCKTGGERFRCQFFYSDADHYGTGRDEYDDLAECTLAVLRVQADHEKLSAGVSSGATAAQLADDEYPGPPSL